MGKKKPIAARDSSADLVRVVKILREVQTGLAKALSTLGTLREVDIATLGRETIVPRVLCVEPGVITKKECYPEPPVMSKGGARLTKDNLTATLERIDEWVEAVKSVLPKGAPVRLPRTAAGPRPRRRKEPTTNP